MEETASQRFRRISEGFLKQSWEHYPSWASGLGLHQYDGLMPDISETARSSRLRQVRSVIVDLESLEASALTGQELWDYQLLLSATRREVFGLTELRSHENNPMGYLGYLDVSDYIKRDYAPLGIRARALTDYLAQIPRLVAQAKINLLPELPLPILNAALEAFQGIESFYQKDLMPAFESLEGNSTKEGLETAREMALASIRDLIADLKSRRPHARAEFALGAAYFQKTMALGEMVSMPLEDLLKIGQQDLERNLERIREATSLVDSHRPIGEVMEEITGYHPRAEELVPYTASILEEIRQYLIDHDIVTVPSELRCTVTETPSFMRWAFAALDAPGPFEAVATEAFYYVTPVEPHWTEREKEDWLKEFNYYTIKNVSVHEAYPGHYVQLLHRYKTPSKVSSIFGSYAFSEGWGHYVEEMMQEEGYGDGDPRLRVAQLSDALTRNCRFVCSIKMHTSEMTLKEATQFFMENAFMGELPARKEAIRGTFDPGYLNYTLGKLMIIKLREDCKKEARSGFSLGRFHDNILSFGAPPVPMLRHRILKSPGEGIL